ncbi:MAG: hypothetical protein ACQEXQ_20415 [Bacillota bacterium]
MKKIYYSVMITMILVAIMLVIMFLINNQNMIMSADYAEKIVLDQAKQDGYMDVKICTRLNVETNTMFMFSEEEKKDIEVWRVCIDADQNAPAAIYYLSAKDGSVLSKVGVVTDAGMDLQIKNMSLNIDDQGSIIYSVNILNSGNINYMIEWIQPFINTEEKISDKLVNKEVDRLVAPQKDLEVMGSIKVNTVDKKIGKNYLIGFLIKVKGENETLIINPTI